MRKLALWSLTFFIALSIAPPGRAVDDPCRKWSCSYEFTGVEGEDPTVRCEERMNNQGQWVTCNVSRSCMWVVDESGRHRQCTSPYCEGEYCMWV
jgi:hypothetical protein